MNGLSADILALTACLALCAAPSAALTVGEADFAYSSELAAQGFTPFATSGVGNAIYGMRKESAMYLCFIADTSDDQTQRQTVLLSEIRGNAPDRALPNIPVVCVQTQ